MTKRKSKPVDRDIAKVLVYLRVSTTEQAEEGVSLEAQEHRIVNGYCKLKGLAVERIIVDAGVSASKPLGKRKGGGELLDIINDSDVGGVVVVKLDRLFRDTVDCLVTAELWRGMGVSMHVLDFGGSAFDTGSPFGAVFITMAAAFAELERKLIGQRTKAALATKKRKGEQVGRVPYGYQLGPKGLLEAHTAEQGVLSDIRGMRAEKVTLREITARLNEEGIQPPPARNGGRQGKRWHLSTVHYLLKREEPKIWGALH